MNATYLTQVCEKECYLLVTVGGKDADTDDCMDAGVRVTQDAQAERTGKYL